MPPADLRALVEQARHESRGRTYNEHSLYPKLIDGLAALLDENAALREQRDDTARKWKAVAEIVEGHLCGPPGPARKLADSLRRALEESE